MEKYTLKFPVQFGSETVTTLDLKPSAGAFKGFKQEVDPDGGVVFDPYASALVAVRMSGRPEAFAKELHPADMMALATVAMRFFSDGLEAGSAPSE